MAGRFSEAELQTFMFDPREPAGLARCPFCGGDIVLGVRKTSRNVALAHAAHPDPTDPSGTRFVNGCEPYNAIAMRDDVIRQLVNAGARFQKINPS